MSFGPGTGSIVLKLLEKNFTPEQVKLAEDAGVSIVAVALVEQKLWIDFCEAIGDLTVHDDCIDFGRTKFLGNVVKFLKFRDSISDAMRRSQICTTRAGVKAADLAADLSNEISLEDYKHACSETLLKVVKALKKLPRNKVFLSPMAPLCDGEAKKLLGKK